MDILQVTFMDIPQPRVPNFVMHEYIYVFKVHLGHVYWYVSKSIVPESIHEYMLQTPQPFLVTFLHIMQPFIKILFTWIHIYVQTAIACILILFDIDCFQNHLCNIFFTRMNTWRQTIIASFHTSATLACMFVWNRLFPKPFMQTTHERIEIKNMRTSGNRSPSLNKTGPRFLASWKISTLLIIQYILYMNDWMNICCKLRNHLW